MLIMPTRLLLPFAAALLAGAFAACAQTGSPQTDAYLAQLRKENSRHDGVTTKLKNDRLDAVKQRVDEEIDCTAITGQAQRISCVKKAADNYAKAERKIEKDENAERTLHQKNISDLQSTINAYCTRPDCVNSSPGHARCSGGSCK
jgi:predicted DNA binding CopG/RHH family protein